MSSEQAVPLILSHKHPPMFLRFKEIWRGREFLYFLMMRDLKVRYRQTILGVLWIGAQPVVMATVFSIVFGQFLKLSAADLPYPLFSFSGVVIWTFLSSVLMRGTFSLVASQDILTKTYFPRMIAVLSATLPTLLDLLFGLVVLVGLTLYWGWPIQPHVVWALPLVVTLGFLFSFAASLWLSILTLRFRDLAHVIPVGLQLLMYCSPVVFSSTVLPERLRGYYGLNPVAGVIEGFRWAFFGSTGLPVQALGASAVVVIALLISGLIFFNASEDRLVDYL